MSSWKLGFAFVLFAGFAGQAQAWQKPLTDEEKTVVQVYEVPGYTKDDVFTSARIWIAETFKSAKAVIEYESKEDGVLVGNGNIAYPCHGFKCVATGDWRVPFTMKVETKDGKFRLTFTNIHLSLPASYGSFPSPAREVEVWQRGDMDAIRPKLLELGNDIVASMGKVKSSDNW